ncbi:MAG: SRPBCC family protein [Alphaproteobacteria bacterium]|nr:SRPBCC family protein [Alphaproteobacteria bacterium]
MLKIILIGIVFAVGVVLGLAATKPDSFRYESTQHINATPEEIFPLVSNLPVMNQWSPFAQIDPAAKIEYSGTESGVGSIFTWDGNDKAGAGRIEITSITAPTLVQMKLDFIRPMTATNMTDFILEPTTDGGTNVTWAMYGPQPFIGKLMSVFIDCEKMVTAEFEKGLVALKGMAEE